MIQDGFAEFLAGQRQGVLVTLRPNGRPQLSNVNYAWYPEEQAIKVSTTEDRAKTANLRRDPRASFHVTSGDFWSYVLLAEGAVDLAAEPALSLWDMAALAPIVTEAGGRFSGLNGVDGVLQSNAAASNGLLHAALLEAIGD